MEYRVSTPYIGQPSATCQWLHGVKLDETLRPPGLRVPRHPKSEARHPLPWIHHSLQGKKIMTLKEHHWKFCACSCLYLKVRMNLLYLSEFVMVSQYNV